MSNQQNISTQQPIIKQLSKIDSSSNSSLNSIKLKRKTTKKFKNKDANTRQSKRRSFKRIVDVFRATRKISRQFNIIEDDNGDQHQQLIKQQQQQQQQNSNNKVTIIKSNNRLTTNSLLHPPALNYETSSNGCGTAGNDTLSASYKPETLSRKSSCNSVRFGKYFSITQAASSSQDTTNYLFNTNPNNATQSQFNIDDYQYLNNLINDLINEADTLEKSIRKNDKYAVRRILDNYYYLLDNNFKTLNNQLNTNNDTTTKDNENNDDNDVQIFSKLLTNKLRPNATTATPTRESSIEPSNGNDTLKKQEIPLVFINILHLSIEHNSLDVLRICLKYGYNPNECGISSDLLSSNSPLNQPVSIKYPFKCLHCLNEPNSRKTFNQVINNQLVKERSSIYSLINNEQTNTSFDSTKLEQNLIAETTTATSLYTNLKYLLKLPPLFLSISKCCHYATELLLEYNACPNIQDKYGNTPLHLACAKLKPCKECISLLIKYHASSLNVYNNLYQTPYSILKLNNDNLSIKQLNNKLIEDLFSFIFNTSSQTSIQNSILINQLNNLNYQAYLNKYLQQKSLTNTLISAASITTQSPLSPLQAQPQAMSTLYINCNTSTSINQLKTQSSCLSDNTYNSKKPFLNPNLVSNRHSTILNDFNNNNNNDISLKKSISLSSPNNAHINLPSQNVTSKNLLINQTLLRQSSDNPQSTKLTATNLLLNNKLNSTGDDTITTAIASKFNSTQQLHKNNSLLFYFYTQQKTTTQKNTTTINDSKQISTDYDTNTTTHNNTQNVINSNNNNNTKIDSLSLVSSKLSLLFSKSSRFMGSRSKLNPTPASHSVYGDIKLGNF